MNEVKEPFRLTNSLKTKTDKKLGMRKHRHLMKFQLYLIDLKAKYKLYRCTLQRAQQ